MTSKHTLGPWYLNETRVYFGCDGGIDLRAAPNATANARLIAMAPRMYEALKKVVHELGDNIAFPEAQTILNELEQNQ